MKHPTEGQSLLKIPEVAARLSVSRATVYRLIAAGALTAVPVKTARTIKTAGHARIPSSAVDAYIERMSAPAP